MSEETHKLRDVVPPQFFQCHRNAMHCRLAEDLAQSIERSDTTVNRQFAIRLIREAIRNLEHDTKLWGDKPV